MDEGYVFLRKDYLSKLKAVSYWDRKKMKRVIDEALGDYLKEKRPSVQIIVTATCKNSVLDTIRKEFNRIVLSIKM